jgi:protein-S-isoprenylcysteine O-methyltransferase Ste14
MRRDEIAALVHVVSAMLVLGMSFLTRPERTDSGNPTKLLGTVFFLLGMGLFTWALVHLKEAFLGNVSPRTEHLVTSGPYRWIRHPVYLAMLVVISGLAIGMRSLVGVLATLTLFLPASAYKAKLEEHALAETFGDNWQAYTERTYFMLPPLW